MYCIRLVPTRMYAPSRSPGDLPDTTWAVGCTAYIRTHVKRGFQQELGQPRLRKVTQGNTRCNIYVTSALSSIAVRKTTREHVSPRIPKPFRPAALWKSTKRSPELPRRTLHAPIMLKIARNLPPGAFALLHDGHHNNRCASNIILGPKS